MSEATVYLTDAQALLLLGSYGVYVLAKVVLVSVWLRRRARGFHVGGFAALSLLPPVADVAYYRWKRRSLTSTA